MSMNLMFNVKGSTAYVDFPFQTPTDLTYAVIREKDIDKRVQLVKDYIKKSFKDNKNDYVISLIEECKTLMRDEKLELTYL